MHSAINRQDLLLQQHLANNGGVVEFGEDEDETVSVCTLSRTSRPWSTASKGKEADSRRLLEEGGNAGK